MEEELNYLSEKIEELDAKIELSNLQLRTILGPNRRMAVTKRLKEEILEKQHLESILSYVTQHQLENVG